MREFQVSGSSVFWRMKRSGILQNTVGRKCGRGSGDRSGCSGRLTVIPVCPPQPRRSTRWFEILIRMCAAPDAACRTRNRASRCDASDLNRAQTKPPKSRPVADLSGVVRPDATAGTSSGGGTRTTPRTLRFGGGFGDPRCNFRRRSTDHRVDCRPATTATHSDRSRSAGVSTDTSR